jgi:two-component system CheB/CheR fusion protein
MTPSGISPVSEANPVDFSIVGIGASEGYLSALHDFLAGMPSSPGMAFVLILQGDGAEGIQLPIPLPNQMAIPLVRCCHMPVKEARDGDVVQPDTMYLASLHDRVGIEHGVLRITPWGDGEKTHKGIDAFFTSLALYRPGSAIGVLLSASEGDGNAGLAAIKAAGGIIFRQDGAGQDRDSADDNESDAMVLPPGVIAKHIVDLGGVHDQPGMRVGQEENAIDEHPVGSIARYPVIHERILDLLQSVTQSDFKQLRSLSIESLDRLVTANGKPMAWESYVHHLSKSSLGIDALAQDIVLSAGSVYQDRELLSLMASSSFLSQLRNGESSLAIRVWIVGCATGFDAYAFAIELIECLRYSATDKRVQIFATDQSSWAIDHARHGCFSNHLAEMLPPDRLQRYFQREGDGYRICKRIRDICVFARHDIAADIPFSKLDIICCWGVPRYSAALLDRAVIRTFHRGLNHGGMLLLPIPGTQGDLRQYFMAIDETGRFLKSAYIFTQCRREMAADGSVDELDVTNPGTAIITSDSGLRHIADQIVLNRLTPAGFLVTVNLDIIQCRGDVSPYFDIRDGDADRSLLDMVSADFGKSLSEAVEEVRQKLAPIRRERQMLICHHERREIAFEVIPITSPVSEMCLLVLFEGINELGIASGLRSAGVDCAGLQGVATASDQSELCSLRNELAAATAYINALEKRQKIITEQLKESLEETQSSNEEYRSTNEELQTIKAEVESSNRELLTVNEALRATNSDLRAASAVIRVSGDLTSAIVEAMRYPLLVLSRNFKIERTNQAFLNFFGISRQDAVGHSVFEIGHGSWDIPELRSMLSAVLPNEGKRDELEIAHEFGHLGARTIRITARGIRGNVGNDWLVVLVIDDITDQVRMMNDLKLASRELLRSNADLDHFAVVASHDLQEPLGVVSIYLEVLKLQYGNLFDDRARQYMTHIANGAMRMTEMIRGILALSRPGSQVIEMGMVDCAEVYRDARANLAVRIEEARASITVDPLPTVRAHREQLTQIFQNLLGNAIKYRSDGRPLAIRISVSESERMWTFSISDNGIGVKEEDFTANGVSQILEIQGRVEDYY